MSGGSKKSPPMAGSQKTLLSFFQKGPSPFKAELKDKPRSHAALSSSPARSPKYPYNQEPLLTPTRPSTDNSISKLSEPKVKSEPSLSTPESSSQPLSSSSPIKSGRRSRKRLMVMDSDSEFDAAEESSEDDWHPAANQEEEANLKEESDDEFMADELTGKQELCSEIREDESVMTSAGSATNTRKRSSPSSPVEAARALSKYSKGSDYTPSEGSSRPASAPSPAKKVRVTTDPERYKWLLNIKDADGNSPSDPNYDPRTLHVPNSAWAKFTPFEKQYWEVKQKLWNTVVFFKKGKFYELYENDAEIAHRLFDLKLAGGGRANMSLCGVPEMSFDYWASAFIAKGYKVARVDQAETALGKEMRDIANKKKEEKIIRRELSCVLTGGTLTDSTMLVSDLSQYCMAIKQDGLDFAACFVDTATAQFFLSRFTDKSNDYPMLESLMAQVRPKEIIIARGNLTKFATKVIKNNTSTETLWEVVKADEEFWDADTSRLEISKEQYFESDTKSAPKLLFDSLESSDLSASAIGGLVWYLRTLKLDEQLLSLGQFKEYDASISSNGKTMVLDGQTLQNLEVFANSWDGGSDGTLFKLLNRCVTPFGKRRLRSWLAHPLQNLEDISCRANMVDMLMEQEDVASMLSEKLIGLPDIERMLSRVHAGTLKPNDFVKLVGGLESMANVLVWLHGLRSQLPQLEPFIGENMGSTIKDLQLLIEPWLSAFDHVEAKTNDRLVPQAGVDEEFDRTREAVVAAEAKLGQIMKQYKKDFKSNNLEYRDSGKEIYLIEVPTRLVKQVPHDWQQMGATAKFKRFWSPEVKKLVRVLQEALELHKISSQACCLKLYKKFCTSHNYNTFMDATRLVSAIDCLLSLSKTSKGMVLHCRPEIISSDGCGDEGPVVEFTELRHPVAASTDFIPNDITLGGSEARMSLLTGANAAGKSTVLRTTCSAILLAQLGCHVPAKSARLTPVDRIMTRLGASDNIFAGKSTFHMELAETERILSEATARSFVVLDELGRGGSSSDGFAIAEAVLHHLATHKGCMGFFATHYANLYDSFVTHPQVKPERMAIEVDKDNRNVTFLYKLEHGRSEGSFGMNVASMCGVSPDIVAAAERAAKLHEHTSLLKRSNMSGTKMPLGLQSDVFWSSLHEDAGMLALKVMLAMASQQNLD